MNLHRHFLAPLLAIAILTIVSGCGTTQHVDAPRTQMTVYEARKALAESLSHLYYLKSVRNIEFDQYKVTFIGSSQRGKPCECSVSFHEMKNLALVTGAHPYATIVTLDGSQIYFYKHDLFLGDPPDSFFETENAAKMFIDAVLTLKQSAPNHAK